MTRQDDVYEPKPKHKFSFGLWTVGNRGRDPFGDFVRSAISPVEIVYMPAEVGAWGVNLHASIKPCPSDGMNKRSNSNCSLCKRRISSRSFSRMRTERLATFSTASMCVLCA